MHYIIGKKVCICILVLYTMGQTTFLIKFTFMIDYIFNTLIHPALNWTTHK